MHSYAEYVNPVLAERLQKLNLDKVFTRGEGSCLTDSNGQVYLDFIASYGALPFGFNPPEIWQAITTVRDQAEPSFVQPSFLEAAGELARRLIELAPPGLQYVTFANSGAEAVEAALKMARVHSGRLGILTTANSFHGKTLGALSATGKDHYQQGFGAPAPGFERIPYGDLNRLEEALRAKPDYYAALIVEPIQGEGGIIIPPKGYLWAARELCHQFGTLLIVDEIQTGLGRTGKLFACEAEGLTPDIITLAKALGGGILPVGACLATAEVYSDDFALKHSSTFANNTLGCRVGLQVLEMLTRNERQLLQEVEAKGHYLLQQLAAIRDRYPEVIAAVRGRGLMLGLELGANQSNLPESLLGVMADQDFLAPVVASYLLNVEKLRVAPTLNGAAVLRLEPPLNITQAQCQQAIEAIARMAERLATGNSAYFLAHLVGAVEPAGVTQKAVPKVTPLPSVDRVEGRFAFLVHPLYLKNYTDFDPSLACFSEKQLRKLVGRWNDLMEPFVISKAVITSAAGVKAYGEFICVARTSDELMALPKEQVRAELEAAIELAREHGAQIVGLGAYTSVVSKGGRELKNLGVALTTGNSYTVAAAVDATLLATQRLGIPLSGTKAAVVGATGSIGRACALLLAERVSSLMLIGNPNNQEHSRRRLLKVSAEIYQYLNRHQGNDGGELVDFVRNHPRIPKPTAELEEYLEFAKAVSETSPLIYTTNIAGQLPQAEIVLTATSQVNSLITPQMLKWGAVVCDVARPPDVSLEVREARPDVLVIDGGVVAVPGRPDLGWNFGFEQGLAYACMSETMMLALEKRYQHFSLGVDLDTESIALTRHWAGKHGFSLAGLRSFDQPLAEQTWERVIQARARQLAADRSSTAVS